VILNIVASFITHTFLPPPSLKRKNAGDAAKDQAVISCILEILAGIELPRDSYVLGLFKKQSSI